MKKPNINKLISKLKSQSKKNLNDKITEALVPKPYRERDMRQESIDMGSHGASEYFGGPK